jgi:hypothetical protein
VGEAAKKLNTLAGPGWQLKIVGTVATVEIDLAHDGGISASGKSRVIASSRGNIDIPMHNGAKLGFNCYRKM